MMMRVAAVLVGLCDVQGGVVRAVGLTAAGALLQVFVAVCVGALGHDMLLVSRAVL